MNMLLRSFLSRCVRKGSLAVQTASGKSFAVGDGTGIPVGIQFLDRGAEREILLDPAAALGELFTQGRLVMTRGSIANLLDLLGRNLDAMIPPAAGRLRQRARTAMASIRLRNTARRARRQIAHHYDQDRRLYELFLDADLQYSCAYFEHPNQSLEAAQRAKKRHIAAKLCVKPGARILDIGCGWGGLALYLAKTCGASVTGITLAQGQLDVANKRAADNNLSPSVEFRLLDYRAVTGTFDRIVSVGMFEHVGPADYGTYFKSARELLADDGVMLLHSIGRFDGVSATNPWIEKNVFPGGHIPALSEVLPEIEKSGLIVTDIQILRLHYAETLASWRNAFLQQREKAVQMFGDGFCRMWEFYLAASEAGFRHGNLMVFQIQLAKRLDTVPLTRDYIANREAELTELEFARDGLREAAE
jgi:cyclopropane-fatty-acyl-phospholipid synthase